MEAGFVVLMLFVGILGILIGLFIGRSVNKPEDIMGSVYVYHDKSENRTSLLLEYSVPIDDITSRKRVTFDVVVVE